MSDKEADIQTAIGVPVDRGEVAPLLDLSERQARRVVSELLAREAITSTGNRAPLRLRFSARLSAWWMPGLFPGQHT